MIKTLFISDRFAEYQRFIRNSNPTQLGIDLLTHSEAHQRYFFTTFYDLFIVDLNEPWMAFPPWIREQARQHYFHQYIFISDAPLSHHLKNLLGKHIYKVLKTTEAQAQLEEIVRQIRLDMGQHKYQSYTDPLTDGVIPYGLLGNDPAIVKINRFIKLVSRARYTPCLIRGENGTGKRLCAYLIHRQNNLRDDLLHVKNCENTTTNELLADLFGVEQDSKIYGPQRRGLLELFNGGTLILKNIEKLPPLVQDKLLFYLEERLVKPVDGKIPVEANTRIIGITRHNLEWFVKHQNFSPDLFYHLNAFEIELPPLRDRADDIPLIANYYRQFYNYPFGKNVHEFSARAERVLKEFKWPGNITELKDVVEKAVYLCTSDHIGLQELPEFLKGNGSAEIIEENELLGSCSMREIEKVHIERVLQNTNGNKSRAASILDISRTTLREKIRIYGINA